MLTSTQVELPKNNSFLVKFSKSILISITVGLIFLLYLITVGIPKTAARNLYNQAQTQLEQGNIKQARDLLNQAHDSWPEGYIKEAIKQIDSLK